MYYNKSLLAREGLKDAYELQQEGQWTWENFLDIAKKATKDINGDGRIDQWGIAPVFTNQFIIKMFYSNNARFARFDENSRLTYAFDTHESLETFEFVNSLYNVHKVILYERADDNTYDSVLEDFARGKVAILGDDGFLKSEYRFIKDKFHLVFYPKGPSADDYVSSIDRENFYVVPRTASDVKASAAILRQIVANSAGYDQLMESYKSSNENDYNTLLLAGEKILYKEIQDSLINDINFGIIYPIINNSNNFDFKSYVRQKREIIQSRLDNSWNIPMNSGEWQHGS